MEMYWCCLDDVWKCILNYILEIGRVDANRDYGLNGATTLNCAVVGGYAALTQISKLLLDASDDVNSLDPNGKRLGDLIAPISNSAFNSWKKLEVILELYIPFRSGRNGQKIS